MYIINITTIIKCKAEMIKLIIVTLLIANIICIINAEFTCKQADVIQDFQRDKYMGKWYLITRNPTIYDVTLKCLVHNATSLRPDTIFLDINAENIYSEKTELVQTYFKHPVDTKLGLFRVHVEEEIVSGTFDLGLIDIDYDKYAIFQGCNYESEIEYIWVVTRDRVVTDEQFKKLNKQLEEKGVDTKYLVKVHQDDCHN